MSRKVNMLTVFAASPGDVGDERTKLEEIVNEVNLTQGRKLGIRLELIRWETHVYAGVGDDPQAVINEQIKDDYDIFIGIMWCRYGESTKRAGSGTVEEFERAKKRYDSDPNSVKIMIYFKEGEINPSNIDTSQLAKVHEFRESLGDEGILYYSFRGIVDFEQLVRVHLTLMIQDWEKLTKEESTNIEQQEGIQKGEEIQDDDNSEDDIGILDVIEIYEERFEKYTDTVTIITNATEDFGKKMSVSTEKIKHIPKDQKGNISRKAIKALITIVSSDMDEYRSRMEIEIPILSKSLSEGIDAIIKHVLMSEDLLTEEANREDKDVMLSAINTILESMTTARESTLEFRNTIANIPRLTSELNKAKRGVTKVLDRLAADYRNGQSLLRGAYEIVGGTTKDIDEGRDARLKDLEKAISAAIRVKCNKEKTAFQLTVILENFSERKILLERVNMYHPNMVPTKDQLNQDLKEFEWKTAKSHMENRYQTANFKLPNDEPFHVHGSWNPGSIEILRNVPASEMRIEIVTMYGNIVIFNGERMKEAMLAAATES